jgi:hypothetical protein
VKDYVKGLKKKKGKAVSSAPMTKENVIACRKFLESDECSNFLNEYQRRLFL